MPITAKTLDFLVENRMMDSRDWFKANRDRFVAEVETPLLELSARLGPAIAKIDPMITTEPRRTISRIWRDTRFTKDKSIFREVMWLVFNRGKGMAYPAFYFEFSPQRYRYGCGYYYTPPKVMQVMHGMILADDKRYVAAQKALDKLTGFTMDGELYKRAKYPDQPQKKRDWLDRKGIVVGHTGDDPQALFSDDLANILSKAFTELAPIYNFILEAHIAVADKLDDDTNR